MARELRRGKQSKAAPSPARRKQPAPAKSRGAGSISTKTTRKSHGDTVRSKEHTEHVWVEDLPEHPAFVRVGGKCTKNMGDYESVSCDVGIYMPCDPKSVNQCYAACSKFVEDKLLDELDAATSTD